MGDSRHSKKRLRRSDRIANSPYQALEPRQLLATLIANYASDFPTPASQPTDGWQYQWNAPVNGDPSSSSISDPATQFAPMSHTGVNTNWTPDGDLIPQNNLYSGFARLNHRGGHPGNPSSNLVGGATRYSIASYTVSESGFYELGKSFIGLNPSNPSAVSDGVEFRVFVNRQSPVASGVVEQGTRAYFDSQLGFLAAGDSVHVAFGAGGNQNFDFFTTDFSIFRETEREQVVGSYRDDFIATVNPESSIEPRWKYLWNAPTNWNSGLAGFNHRDGAVSDIRTHVPLINAASGVWTADGDLDGLNGNPDYFLKLTAQGGIPGAGFASSVFQDRFAITSFTVPNSGHYAITRSFLSVASRSDDGVELFIQIDDQQPVFSQPFIVAGGNSTSFDMDLGYLKKGEKVNVAFGANGNHIRDNFTTDFQFIRHIPRSAPDLSLLEHEGTVISINEFRFGIPGAIPNDNANDMAAFKAAFSYAWANDVKEIRLNQGTYNLSSIGIDNPRDPYFSLSRFDSLVVNGNGSTLIVDDHTRALFNLHGSSNVIFKDLTIDYAERVPAQGVESNDLYKPLTFTQGFVSDVNHAAKTFTLSVNTNAFLAPDSSFLSDDAISWGYILDRVVDGRLKVGSDWHYPTLEITAHSDPNKFTIKTGHTVGLSNGDRYVLQRRYNVPIFGFYGSENVSVVGVTAYSSPAVFVSAIQSEHVNVIDSHVSIRPDDWTGTPNTKRWKSINADGVHIQSNRTGVWVEGSTFNGLGDDVMNFYSLPLTVAERVSDTEFTLGMIVLDEIRSIPTESIKVGDHLTFFDPVAGMVMREVRVTNVRETLSPDPMNLNDTLRLHTVTIDQPVRNVTVGTSTDEGRLRNETTVFNTSASRSSLVQDSYLGNSRRYGNFLMADNVQLLDNVYEGLSDEAIAAHNEPGWPLGLFANDILVQGNQFLNNGFSLRYLQDEFHSGTVAFQSARYVDASASGTYNVKNDFLVDEHEFVYNNIQIRDNVFYHWRKSAISIRNAANVSVVGNTISEAVNANLVSLAREPIQVHFAQNVTVKSNAFVGETKIVGTTLSAELETSQNQHVFNRDLDAWFKFDGGEFLRDSSQNQAVPNFNGAGLAQGKFDTAAVFNSTNSITLTGLKQEASSSRTISLWFDPVNVESARKQVLYEEGNANVGMNIYVEHGKLIVGGWSAGSFTTFLETTLSSNDWNHVALVLDGSRNKLRGYLNGHKFSVGNAFVIPARDGTANLGNASLNGTRFPSTIQTGEGTGFAGRIDDVKIYRRALGDGEISGLAERT